MPANGMRVVTINYYFDHDLDSPDELLDRYRTLTGWAVGLAHAGADVTVVQRFSRDAELERSGIRYQFVHDGNPRPRPLDSGGRVNAAVADIRPDVVHVNGLQFARQAWCLKRLLPHTPLLLQDHADHPSTRPLSRAILKYAMASVQGVSFAAADLARPWVDAGIMSPDMPIFELMEGSTHFQLLPAGARTRSDAGPTCLWVGRLDENKDPMTVLRGFASALDKLPRARLVMVHEEAPLLPQVRQWLAANPAAARRITLLGSRPHAEMEALYNSAQFLLLGSHHEGSGYAVIEALACGVVPIVTDIPSFRILLDNGRFGGLWPIGDREALTRTLLDWNARWRPETPRATRAHFEEHWSFDAIGRKAMAAYASLGGR